MCIIPQTDHPRHFKELICRSNALLMLPWHLTINEFVRYWKRKLLLLFKLLLTSLIRREHKTVIYKIFCLAISFWVTYLQIFLFKTVIDAASSIKFIMLFQPSPPQIILRKKHMLNVDSRIIFVTQKIKACQNKKFYRHLLCKTGNIILTFVYLQQ